MQAHDHLKRTGEWALLVDNEPTPFWSGDGQKDRVEEWRDRVQWQPAWGEASAPARGVNGPSGAWAERWVLAPLGVGRDEVCISGCLDTARLNPSWRKQDPRAAPSRQPPSCASTAIVLPGPVVRSAAARCSRVVKKARIGRQARSRTSRSTC